MSTPCPSQIAPAFISNPAIHVKRHTKIPPIMNPPCDPCDLCVSFREIINKTIAEREIKQRNKAITNKRESGALMLTPLRAPKSNAPPVMRTMPTPLAEERRTPGVNPIHHFFVGLGVDISVVVDELRKGCTGVSTSDREALI